MPATKATVVTGNPYTDGLLSDTQWATDRFTFSFPTQASLYGNRYGSGEPGSGFASLNAGQQAAVRAVLADYAEIAKVSFAEIQETATQHADLRFGMSATIDTAQAYLPSPGAEAGDVWFGTWGGAYDKPVPGNYAWVTIVHEFGHALGLDHPHEGRIMPADRDSIEYTVMSYRSYVGGSTTSGYTSEDPGGFPSTPMLEDVAAVQHMYGANFATRSGDTLYSWSPATGELAVDGIGQGQPAANRILATVWDGGGTDTYDFSAYSSPVAVDLRPGGWTTTGSAQLAHLSFDGKIAVGNIANAYLYEGDARSLIENARGGSASDTITGNQAANVLEGGLGGDRLDGAGGLDTASYRHAAVGVTASLGDASINLGDAKGDSYASIEALEGSAHADHLLGDGGNNVLSGLGGSDSLYGGAGADSFLFVGPGNGIDTIVDMRSGEDRIVLDHVGFGLGAGGSVATAGVDFVLGTAATEARPTILYDAAGGLVSFDVDGVGAGTALAFASLGGASSGGVRMEIGGRSGASWTVGGVGDFNGDGATDVFWHNAATGNADQWQLRDGGWAQSIDFGSRGTDWRIGNTGDFNGDGTDDVFWRNDRTGQVDQWQLKNGYWAQSTDFGSRGTDWNIAGIGDFNGDGTDDVFWRNDRTGQIDQWQLKSGYWAQSIDFGQRSTDWRIAGIGDFNGDGSDDALWSNASTHQSDAWHLAKGYWQASFDRGILQTGNEVVGTGDVNADGKDDVLYLDTLQQKISAYSENALGTPLTSGDILIA